LYTGTIYFLIFLSFVRLTFTSTLHSSQLLSMILTQWKRRDKIRSKWFIRLGSHTFTITKQLLTAPATPVQYVSNSNLHLSEGLVGASHY